MKSRILCLCILLLSIAAIPALAQEDKPTRPAPWPTNKVNSALTTARVASAQQRFEDSEKLMLEVTQANPQQVLAWVELGNAQLGLKKYPEAESSYKMALGVKPEPASAASPAPAAPIPAKSEDLVEQYIRSLPQFGGSSGKLPPLGGGSGGLAPPGGGSGGPSPAGSASDSPPATAPVANPSRSPQVLGPVYASLGEVYAHEAKIPEAVAAFDQAVAELPAQAAQYRSNETIVFFQTGQGDAEYTAAKQALALDPDQPSMYYFEGQALLAKATIDPKTQKMTLTPECIGAFKKFLRVSPNEQLKGQVRGILTAAGVDPGK